MVVYEKKEYSKNIKDSRTKLIKLFEEQDKRITKLRELINEYQKDKEQSVGIEAQELYKEIKQTDKDGIKRNTYFKSTEGRKEFPNDKYKRFSHPGGIDGLENNVKLFTTKRGMNDIIAKHLFEGSNFDRPTVRGKKEDVPMATPVDEEEKEETKEEEGGVTMGTKQGDISELKEDDTAKQKQEMEVTATGSASESGAAPPPPVPGADKAKEVAKRRYDDFMKNTDPNVLLEASEAHDEGFRINDENHKAKEKGAFKKVIEFLGDGFHELEHPEKMNIFHYFYAKHTDENPPEADKPGVPEVNNDEPGFTPLDEPAITQEDIDSLNIEDDKIPEPDPIDPQQAAAAMAADNVPVTQMDMPEFRPFNPISNEMDIEIDDVSPAGGTMQGTVQGGGAPPVGAFTSSNIMNSINFPTDEAQKMIEDRMRNKKDIEALKDEIRAMHLLYDDDIPQFKKNPHKQQKEDALASNDLNKVKAHHKSMQNTIRNYYKTSDLKVGVILSSEAFFGSNYASHPNLAALTQPRVPEYETSRVRAVKRGHEFDNAVSGETRVNRLGRNYRKPVTRNVPKVGGPTMATMIKEPKQVPDVERPLNSQRGYRQRRVSTNIGMPIILKTAK
jgi:phage-related protein